MLSCGSRLEGVLDSFPDTSLIVGHSRGIAAGASSMNPSAEGFHPDDLMHPTKQDQIEIPQILRFFWGIRTAPIGNKTL